MVELTVDLVLVCSTLLVYVTIYIRITDTQNRLGSWQKVLTDNGLKINVAKTEHLSTNENPLQTKLNVEERENVDHFKYMYLGSVIDKDDIIDRDVDLRVQALWSSWIKLTGYCTNGRFPSGSKRK